MNKESLRLLKVGTIKTLLYLSITSLILYLVFMKNLSYGNGLLAGGFISLVNLYITAFSVNHIFYGQAQSGLYYMFFYVLKMVLSGVVLFAAIKFGNSLSLITTFIGLFSVRVILTLEAIFKSKYNTYGA